MSLWIAPAAVLAVFWLWFLARGKALRDRDGRVVKWFGMLTELDRAK